MLAPPTHHPMTPAARRLVSSSSLLAASRLGGDLARADLVGDPAAAAAAYASWRRLRRRTGRQSRQLLRVAFDTGYGRAMQSSALVAAAPVG